MTSSKLVHVCVRVRVCMYVSVFLYFEYEPGNFERFKISRPYVSAHEWQKFTFFT